MKKIRRIVILVMMTAGTVACEYEPFPELPPETQTGEQTFGCLVNNELVFAWSRIKWGYAGGWKEVDALAEYYVSSDELTINAKCQFEQKFIITVKRPYTETEMFIDSIQYLPLDSGEWMKSENTGNIRITRIDNQNRIVSGTFSFDLKENGKTMISVTKGRFDLPLNIYPQK